jgi:hypothetical protein
MHLKCYLLMHAQGKIKNYACGTILHTVYGINNTDK